MSADIIRLAERRKRVEYEHCVDPETGTVSVVFELIEGKRRVPLGCRENLDEALDDMTWLRGGRFLVVEAGRTPDAIANRLGARLFETFNNSLSPVLRACAASTRDAGATAALSVLGAVQARLLTGADPQRDIEAAMALGSIDLATRAAQTASPDRPEIVAAAEWLAARASWVALTAMAATALNGSA